MNGKRFKDIRDNVLKMTQRELANALGYRHKIRISEFERDTNPVAIPRHIVHAMLTMGEDRWQQTRVARKWQRRR